MRPPLDPDHAHFAAFLDWALTTPGTSHVWSPHSVGTALALLALGSRDELRQNLTHALVNGLLDATDEERALALTAHLSELDSAVAPPGARAADPDVVSVNGLYVSAAEPVLPGFEAVLRARPGSGVRSVDFTSDPERVREDVNAAVGGATRGLIPQALPPGSVTADTVAVLVNALWVRMDWITAFSCHRTTDRVFHTPDGERAVPTMVNTISAGHARAAGWRMVTLPGEHGTALDVLMPEDGVTDPPTPSPETLSGLHEALRVEPVRVALPRFRVESSFELARDLGEIPFLDVFGGFHPELDGITGHPLRLDSIVHQAVLSVDEAGVEGAAVTVTAVPGSASRPPEPVAFTVDRPFRFVLRRRGAVLFTGRVLDPVDPGPAQTDRRGVPAP
ncbi:serpin family protein [Nocardiopsis ganjiahuensis]|uniref:serpin family protein n=1 Tax=Nocardiopsis ganjiahuensis TaxID=239984 RepID=UPI0003499833|nr:serpin family protein [Nocardiopsis ganjiahuensis]